MILGFAAGGTASAQDASSTTSGVNRAAEPLGPFDTAGEFVRQSYVDLLRREPTPAEHAVATAAVEGGQKAEDFIAGLVALPEMNTNVKQVVRLYRAYYLRTPDARGLQYWIRKRQEGTSLRAISNQFAAAPEFGLRYGQVDDSKFVELVYNNVLTRTPDPAGRDYWLGRLGTGLYRGHLMTLFSESPEYVKKSVGADNAIVLYTGMFQSSISKGLFDYYSSTLQSGNTTTSELARQFLDDTKYHRRF